MICRRCKHEMPDGLRYCGHCGRKMNRVEYFINWSFDKKRLPITLIVLALLIGLLVWGIIALAERSPADLPGSDNPSQTLPADDDLPSLSDRIDSSYYRLGQVNYDGTADGYRCVLRIYTLDKEAEPDLWAYVESLTGGEYPLELVKEADGAYYFRYTGTADIPPLRKIPDLSDPGDCCYWLKVIAADTYIEVREYCVETVS